MFYFTPLPGFFSPFPHGTVSLSVIQEYLALRGGPRRFTRNSTCSMLLGIRFDYFNFRLQDYHFLWVSIPTYSSNCPNLLITVPLPLFRIKFRLLPFRSPLLRESFLLSFPPVTKMFQFSGFALTSSIYSSRSSIEVSLFGYLRITACFQLTEAFRR